MRPLPSSHSTASGSTRTLSIPVDGYLPDGTSLGATLRRRGRGASGRSLSSTARSRCTLPPMSGLVLATNAVDLDRTGSPYRAPGHGGGRQPARGRVEPRQPGAAGYDVWVSPLSGGGYVKANVAPVMGTSFAIDGLENARRYYIIVRALDSAGNASGPSNEVVGLPHLMVGWANLQWPPTITHTVSRGRSDGRRLRAGLDRRRHEPAGCHARLDRTARASVLTAPTPPPTPSWSWVEAAFNTDAGNNDEFVASLLPEAPGDLRLRLSLHA